MACHAHYCFDVNLVTTGNAAISLSACIVGLLLLAPRTSVRAAVRYSVMMLRRPPAEAVIDRRPPQTEVVDRQFQPDRDRELVDA